MLKKKINQDSPSLSLEDLEFVEAGIENIQSIKDHPESQKNEEYSDRLSAGHVCYCMKQNDEILGYHWIAFDSCFINYTSDNEFSFLSLKKNQAFLYDIFVFQEFRRSGVATFLAKNTFFALRHKGITELYVVIGPGNIPSIALHLRNGFEPVRMFYLYSFKKIKKAFVGKESSKQIKEWRELFATKFRLDNE